MSYKDDPVTEFETGITSEILGPGLHDIGSLFMPDRFHEC